MQIQAEANLSALIESTEDLIWSVDPRLRLISFNRPFKEHFEKNFGGPVAPGMVLPEMLPPTRAAFWLPLYERALKGEKFQAEITLIDGRILELSFSPIVVDGETTGVSVFGKDVSERKRAMQALQESEARFRNFFEQHGSILFLIVPESGEIVAANRAASKFYGYSQQQLIGMNLDHINTLPAEEIVLELQRAIREERSFFNFRHRLASGAVREVEVYSSPVEADGRRLLFSIVHDVTERNQAMQALRESEARFHSFFEENGSAMIQVVPETGEVVAANKAAAVYFGVDPEKASDVVISQFILTPPEEWAANRRRVMSRERNVFNHRIRLASGEEREIEAYSSPYEVTGRRLLFSIIHDITDRKRAEEALREKEESLREAQTIAGLGSYKMDIRTGIWQGTDVLQLIFGIDNSYRCDVEGWATIIDPGDRERMTAYFAEEILGKGQTFDNEYRIIRQSDGAKRWVHGLGRLEFDDQGRPARMLGTIQDITERRHAEMQLRDSEERYRATFEQAAVGIVHASFDDRILRCNAYFASLLGYTVEEISGKTIRQITAPDDFKTTVAALKRLRHGHSASEVLEKRYLCKDGSLCWAKLTISQQCDGEGRPIHFIALVEDINERKAVEQKLAEAQETLRLSEVRYRTAFQMNLDSIDICQLEDGKFVDVNEAFLKNLGFDRDEVIGHTALELGIWENPADREKMSELVRQNSFCRNFEAPYRTKNGSLRWGLLSVSLIEMNGIPSILSVTRDITDAKEAKDLLTAAAEALRLSEERYRTVFETSIDAVSVTHEADGRIIDVNLEYMRMFGFEREEVVGRTTLELGIWTDPLDRLKLVEALRREPALREMEFYLQRKNGEGFWVAISGSRIDLEGVPSFLIVVRDISASKAAAEALRLSEDRYHTVFETSPDAIMIARVSDGVIIDANQALFDAGRYERDEVIGRTTQELGIWVNADDRQKLLDLIILNGSCRNLEVQVKSKSGETFWMRLSGSLIEVGGCRCTLTIAQNITEAKAAAEALRMSEERYRTVFETSPDAVILARASDGAILAANQSFLDSTGFARDEVMGRTTEDLGIWVNDSDHLKFVDAVTQNSGCRDMEVLSRKKNGDIFWMRLSAALIEIEGTPCRLVFAKEVTEIKTAAEAMRRSEERYRTAFQTSLDAININRLDNGKYIDCNQAFLDLFGYEREDVIGKTSLQLGIWLDSRDRATMANLVRQNGSYRGLEVQFRKRSGDLFWGVMSSSAMEVDGELCVLSIISDLSEVKAAQNEIKSLAYYDPLTGLPNRRLLLERLRLTLAASNRSSGLHALLLIDLDNLKTLNDALGNKAGDLLLKEVARRILTCAREADTVSRLGGDEFVVLLEDLSEVAEEAATHAKAAGERILDLVSQPYLFDEHEFLNSASIGIVVFGDGLNGTEDILQQADIALHLAKAAGRNTMRFFSPDLQAAVNARAALEEDLRQAIKNNQFLLYYQPLVSHGSLIGAEGLIRWQHPKRGLVRPDDFIPLAEETGLILPMGDWVLDTACAQLAAWAGCAQSAHLSLAVNISALQFRQLDFVTKVLSALERSGANPKNLKLELTESMLVDNFEDVIVKMTVLKEHGLSFSLDDFGTGYSSLAYLKRLPLDLLKIDRAFVRDMLVDLSSGAIAQAIISLGRAMRLSVIAEGVENEAQRSFLADMGCNAYQGYLFSPPLPIEEFDEFI